MLGSSSVLINDQENFDSEWFAGRVVDWQQQYGRCGLPWQGADAYYIWLSEIMLQQTRVATVIPYYLRFVDRFPAISVLAAESEEMVLAYWSGLGYYSRARNLHSASRIIMQQHDGEFPRHFEDILALPGIGRSTAAAISAFAFHERCAILDGNVKRLLARYYAIEGYPGEQKIEAVLWEKAEALLPKKNVAIYTQGMMDLGATICTRSKPECCRCPVQAGCAAHRNGCVAQLPTPRLRKKLPERKTTFLLLRNGPDILLEKHTGRVIWGGLWCPPQLDIQIPCDIESVRVYCRQFFNVEVMNVLALPKFLHTFTHFKLHIFPVLINVAVEDALKAQETGMAWMGLDDAQCAAIPSPVRKLLQEIQKNCW